MPPIQMKAQPSAMTNRHFREIAKEPQKGSEKTAFIPPKPTTEKSALGKMMSKDLDEQFNIFMKMFVTQLQNQDPTEPMDGTQMTNNLLMFFSAAEQAKTNFHLEKLNDTHDTEQLVAAKSYLNKEVTYEGNELTFDGGAQIISADIPKGAKHAEVMIFDPITSQRIKTFRLPEGSGLQTVTWDGSIDGNGQDKVSPGQYMVKVQAEKDQNTWYDISPRLRGTVTAIDYTDNKEFIYYVNNTPVQFEDIQQVRKANRDVSIQELKDSLQQQISSIDHLKTLVEKQNGPESIPVIHDVSVTEVPTDVPEIPIVQETLAQTTPLEIQSTEQGGLDSIINTVKDFFK